ncbi:hypothetical protein [Serratia fonticola]|uniref:hypothetical protein n=1 Tax=Serratia fonticola TaxID=47917 RepID=UPI003AAF70F4
MTISTLMPAMYLTPSSKERGTWHECGKDYSRGQAFYTAPPAISRTATPDDSPYPATIAGGCWLAQAWADGYNARNALTVAPAAPQSDHLKRALKLAGEAKELADRIRAEELTLQAPVVPDDVAAALDWIDDFIARCNGDDRGSCNSVNILRRAILAAAPKAD